MSGEYGNQVKVKTSKRKTITSRKSRHKPSHKPRHKHRRKPIYVGDPYVYGVDELLEQRKKGRKIEYLLKWSGYPNSENSWVDESNITPDLIKLFKSKRPANVTQEQTLNGSVADSYFEEGLNTSDAPNLHLVSAAEHFQLFTL